MNKRVIRTGSLTKLNSSIVDYIAPGELETNISINGVNKIDKIPVKIGYIETTDLDGDEILRAEKVFINNCVSTFGNHYYRETIELDNNPEIIVLDIKEG